VQPVNRQFQALQAGVLASAGASLANPLVAEAAVTPSLKNFLLSLVAGATVLAGIAGAVTAVSSFDVSTADLYVCPQVRFRELAWYPVWYVTSRMVYCAAPAVK